MPTRETEEALHFRLGMPGLGKEDVKVSVEDNTLFVAGKSEEEEASGQEGVGGHRYMIVLPEKVFKLDQIKAEMKNGVLSIAVPKVKEEDRADIIQVKVE